MKTYSVPVLLIVILFVGGSGFAWRYKNLAEVLMATTAELRLIERQPEAARADRHIHAVGTAQSPPIVDEAQALLAEITSLEDEVRIMRDRLSSRSFNSDVREATTFRHVGHSKPTFAVETLFWSLNGGDVSSMEGGIILHPVLKTQADNLYQGLSDSGRQQYKSPEHLVSALLTTGTAVASMQVVDVVIGKNPNIANVRLKLQYADGGSAEPMMTMIRSGSEWRWAVPADTFKKFGGVLSGTLDISAPPSK